MEITKINLIGKKVVVVFSGKQTISGLIVDETKNTVKIETVNGDKKVLKKEAKFRIDTSEGPIIIEGASLIGRPEERLKKKVKVKKRWLSE